MQFQTIFSASIKGYYSQRKVEWVIAYVSWIK